MNLIKKPSYLLLSTTFLVATASFTVFAETASQIIKKSYAPSLLKPSQPQSLTIPKSTELNAPKGADKLYVKPSGLIVNGGFADMAAQTAKIEQRIKNKKVSAEELFLVARQLEEAYARQGFLLTRINLPPQKIVDGEPVKFNLIKGYIGKIDVSELPKMVADRVKKVLTPLLYNNEITKKQLERQLLFASDTPGFTMKSILKAGKDPHSSVLVVEGRYDVVTGAVSIDNGLSDQLGTYSVNLSVYVNNLFGKGDVVYTTIGGYPSFGSDQMFGSQPRNSQTVVGVTVPLDIHGLSFNLEAIDSKTNPNTDSIVSFPSRYQQISAEIDKNWIRSRNGNVASSIRFDHGTEARDLKLDDGQRSHFTKDRKSVIRIKQSGDTYTNWGGYITGDITASFGLNVGARDGTDELPLSRQGAEPDFKKLEASLRYSQPLFNNKLVWLTTANAQTSFGAPLISSEQFVLTGMNSISAYDNGSLAADTGAEVRTELSLLAALPSFGNQSSWGSAVSPYIFGAAGIAKLEDPTSVEREITHASAYGVGVRFNLANTERSNSLLRLEFARGTQTDSRQENRLNMLFVTQF